MGKKILIFLAIIFIVLGCFTVAFKLFSSPKVEEEPEVQPVEVATAETVTTRDILAPKVPEPISDDELIAQIKNKRYLESSYMALEYSKISNNKLIEVLKNYIEDSNGMQPQDIKEIIELHEKTFLNRYLKVYILTVDKTIDPSVTDVDATMKSALYKIKSAYASFSAYGRDSITTDENGTVTNNGPSWDVNILKLGVQELENANTYVDNTLKIVGLADIKIEKAWIDANIDATDLTTVLNKTNVTEEVEDLTPAERKPYTDNNIVEEDDAEIVVDDLPSTNDSDNLTSTPSKEVEEIPFEEDFSLDLSDLQ